MALIPQKNVGSQVERACIALFFEVWPDAAPDFPNFYFSNDWKKRVPPLIDVLAMGAVEAIPFSAVKDVSISIIAEWPGTNQPGTVNDQFNHVQVNGLIGVAEAALRLTDNGQDYKAAALKMTMLGRRLAVLGLSYIFKSKATKADSAANNADMATFVCDFIEAKADVRAKSIPGGGLYLVEERTFTVRAYNAVDDSIFPALTYNGAGALNWTFTVGAFAEPNYWIISKSVDGEVWNLHTALPTGTRTADISGTGTQFWRVVRSDDGVAEQDPESNLVQVTGA